MPTAFIHIGSHKTGTSALQRWLSDHRAPLFEAGVTYLPQMEFAEGDRSLRLVAQMLRGTQPLADLSSWQRLSERLEDGSSDILLSSELWSEQLTMDPAQRLMEFFETRGFDVKFLLYLRDPASFLASLYSQKVKRLRFASRFAVYAHRFGGTEHPSYGQMVAAFDHGERLIVRPFPPPGGDLLKDVLTQMDVSPDVGAGLDRVNLRPTQLEVFAARTAKTRWIEAERPGGLQAMVERFDGLLKAHRKAGTVRGTAFSPLDTEGAAALRERFSGELDAIALRFFGSPWTGTLPPVPMERNEVEAFNDLNAEDRAYVETLAEETFAAHAPPAKGWLRRRR